MVDFDLDLRDIFLLEPHNMAVALVHEKELPHAILKQVPRYGHKRDSGQRRLRHRNAEIELLHLVLFAAKPRAPGEADRGGRHGDAEEEEGVAGCHEEAERGGGRKTEQGQEYL